MPRRLGASRIGTQCQEEGHDHVPSLKGHQPGQVLHHLGPPPTSAFPISPLSSRIPSNLRMGSITGHLPFPLQCWGRGWGHGTRVKGGGTGTQRGFYLAGDRAKQVGLAHFGGPQGWDPSKRSVRELGARSLICRLNQVLAWNLSVATSLAQRQATKDR